MPTIDDHPLRYQLANELHARPFPKINVPCTTAFLAIKQPDMAAARDRALDMAHLVDLLDRHGAPHPQPGATHYYGQIGRHWLKWEQHTEFVTYTLIAEGTPGAAFDAAGFAPFPEDWLARAPGQRITSALVHVAPRPEDAEIVEKLDAWFVPESLAVSVVLDDAAVIAGDFRIDQNGHQRFAVFAGETTGARRIGRIVQRLCEIETYKAMSMLGFARVRALSPELSALDTELTATAGAMADADNAAEDTLATLLRCSATLEALAARASFRFAATAAYSHIVDQRIAALREVRFMGRQSFAEFMMRRYDPAMRTVLSTQARMEAMSARSERASNLLRTRVDVERSAQNQLLLASMDERSDLQLRLQATVEGLSVVAISYYAVSLVGYLAYPLAEALALSRGLLVAAATPPVVGLVWWAVRRIRHRIEKG